MSKCYITLKGEVINPKKIDGTRITEFAIKIDSQDYKTKEWNTTFLNGKLIGEFELETKTIYELTGNFEVNAYTNKDGVEVKQLILAAFNAKEVDFQGKAQEQQETKPKAKKKEVKKEEEEITYSDLPF